MNWISEWALPKIKTLFGGTREVPENLWHKCPACEQMIFHTDLEKNLRVCTHCGHHMRIGAKARLDATLDEGWQRIELPKAPTDPLRFKDQRRYAERLKDAQAKSFAQIELEIADFGKRARDGKLKMEEMQGGTFTISNGGVFGSLMSTPILNPPQSGVLGMHRIEDRPVVVNGQIVIRPMMYLALSYDHRLIDGREAVTYLVRIKEALEDPTRLVIDL